MSPTAPASLLAHLPAFANLPPLPNFPPTPASGSGSGTGLGSLRSTLAASLKPFGSFGLGGSVFGGGGGNLLGFGIEVGGGEGILGGFCGVMAGGFHGGSGFVGWFGTLEGTLAGAGGFEGTGGLPGLLTGAGKVGLTIGLGGLEGTPGAPGRLPGNLGFGFGKGFSCGTTGLGSVTGLVGFGGAATLTGLSPFDFRGTKRLNYRSWSDSGRFENQLIL